MAEQHWDKVLVRRLIDQEGLTWEQAGMIVGIVAEERMKADLQGYARGFDDGYESRKRSTSKD